MTVNFPQFAKAVHANYTAMAAAELFVVDVEDIFATYLAAFPEGTDPVFRKNTEHDCSCCKNFVRNLGRVVTISETGAVGTVWDGWVDLPAPYDVVAERMAAIIRQAPITGAFRTKERQYGTDHNFDTETNHRWHHFVGRIGNRHFSAKPDEARGLIDTAAQTLRRGLDEIKADDLVTVLDLIDSNALYRGEEKRRIVAEFQATQLAYQAASNRDLFVWAMASSEAGQRVARFRNDVIGTMLVDLASGVALEKAVRSFEAKVAPSNYQRPTALITPRMIEDAVATLKAEGLETAVERRFARLSDVSVNNVLFVDNSVRGVMRDGLVGLLMEDVKPQPVDVKRAQLISAADFLGSVVPSAQGIDLLLDNRHLGNFVSLTAPMHADTGRLFKWGNDFAWSYDGEVADSIKERVKAAGGKVDAKFRVSLAWSNFDDLDLHVRTPRGEHIYYGDRVGRVTGGQLDIDMNAGGHRSRDPVENIYWNGKIVDGEYVVQVKNFSRRETSDVGFTLEVELGNVTHQFTHAAGLADQATVHALTLEVRGGLLAKVTVTSPNVVGGSVPTQKWGITTGQLVPVDTLLLSPNHWDGQGVGNRHHFFMLKDCRNPDPVRGIYNEFLRGDLEKHRKVFEALAGKTKCQPTEDQLSGVGFSSTRRDSVVVVVKGKEGRAAYQIDF